MSGSGHNPWLGVWLVARGQSQGLARFGATREAFLASLAPLLAFPIAIALLVLVRFGLAAAIGWLVPALVVQLAPPVLSQALAQRWDRGQLWLHYGVAYNWCYWAPAALALVLLPIVPVLSETMSLRTAVQLLIAALGLYSLWLQWFLARHALALSGVRAFILVLLVNLGTAALIMLPELLG